jgi:hypothetical protein
VRANWIGEECGGGRIRTNKKYISLNDDFYFYYYKEVETFHCSMKKKYNFSIFSIPLVSFNVHTEHKKMFRIEALAH